jgi:hypothetical protein
MLKRLIVRFIVVVVIFLLIYICFFFLSLFHYNILQNEKISECNFYLHFLAAAATTYVFNLLKSSVPFLLLFFKSKLKQYKKREREKKRSIKEMPASNTIA